MFNKLGSYLSHTLVLLLTVVTVSVGVFLQSDSSADEAWEEVYNRRKASVENKLNAVSSQVQEYNKNIYELQQRQSTLAAEISSIQNQIAETNKLIQAAKDELQATEIEIDNNNKELDKLKEDIKSVFIDIQSNQVGSLMEVLFSSQNLDELLGKLSALDTLQSKLNILRAQTESKLKELAANKDLLLTTQKTLGETQSLNRLRNDQLADLLEITKGQESEYQNIVASLAQQKNEFAAEIAKIDTQKQAEAARIARERERQNGSGGGIRSPGGFDPAGADYNACGGVWEAVDLSGLPSADAYTEPAQLANPTRVYPDSGRGYTSGMGCQPFYPGGGAHDALDLANIGGTPIVAFANGVVEQAGWSGPFGNRVVVKHVFGSRRIYSLYAHLSGIDVVVGQSVSKGQGVGSMGTTGYSTGNHLHFSIMDETYEVTRAHWCVKAYGAYTHCYNPFLAPFNLYSRWTL